MTRYKRIVIALMLTTIFACRADVEGWNETIEHIFSGHHHLPLCIRDIHDETIRRIRLDDGEAVLAFRDGDGSWAWKEYVWLVVASDWVAIGDLDGDQVCRSGGNRPLQRRRERHFPPPISHALRRRRTGVCRRVDDR